MADVTLTQIPGFSDLSATPLAADKLAVGIHLARINQNAAFGMTRLEMFHGVYKHDDTVALPVSPIDGYIYNRSECLYIWTLSSTVNPDTKWATQGVPYTMWYGAWKVDQATGKVFSEIGYRGNQDHTDRQATSNDGIIRVFTIAQRQRTNLLLAAANPVFNKKLDTDFYTDRALHTSLVAHMNANAKFGVVNSEVIYMGEFVDGATIAKPVSPADGHVYEYADVKWMASWRWTADTDGNGDPVRPAMSKGQLEDFFYSIDVSGIVRITNFTVAYASYGRHTYSSASVGKIAVFAFCSRAIGTTFAAPQNLFAEVGDSVFYPGETLRASTLKQVNQNTNQAVLSPEFFGPTDYAHGATIPLPVSAIDGYNYVRAELMYIYQWNNTGPATETNGRIVVATGDISAASGVVSINKYRLDTAADTTKLYHEGTISVIVVAKRRITHSMINASSVFAPDWTTDPAGDDPTGPLFGENLLPNFGFEEVNQATLAATDASRWSVALGAGTTDEVTAARSLTVPAGFSGIATMLTRVAQSKSIPAGATRSAILNNDGKISIADAEGYAVRAKIKNQRDAASYVPMTDTFTDTVGALLSAHLSTPGGAVWTKKAATNDFKIDATGGKIMLTTASVAIASYFSEVRPLLTTYTLQCDVDMGTSTVATDLAGVLVQGTDLNNYFRIVLVGGVTNASLKIDKVVAGVVTNIQAATVLVGKTGTLKVVVTPFGTTGVTMACSFNNTLIFTKSDASLGLTSTSKYVGLVGGAANVNVRWDNWSLDGGLQTTGLAYTFAIVVTGNRVDGSTAIIARRLFTFDDSVTPRYVSCHGVVPATPVGTSPWAYATFAFYTYVTNTTVAAISTPAYNASDTYWDDINLIRVANTAGDEVLRRGSIPPAYTPGLTFTSTDASITWNWDLLFQRTDLDLNVERLVGSQVVTGLTQATSYNFYPYADENAYDPFLSMVATGGVGVPSWAHIGISRAWTAEQTRADHAPLSLAPVAASTAATGGSGGGGGGGDTGCLRSDVLVEERRYGIVPIGSLAPGMYWLRCPVAKDTPEGWVRVKIHPKRKHHEWIHTEFGDGNGGMLDCVVGTCGHPWILTNNVRKTSAQLCMEDEIGCLTGVTWPVGSAVRKYEAEKVPVTCDSTSHIFYCGMLKPQIETHNFNTA